MASQLPNFTLELHGDMKANWEYFCETFESYVTLMGYRPKYTAKEMAAVKYALPKEARAVLKNSIKWEQGEDQQDPALTLKKLGSYYAGTKNIIHERVLFNRMKREENDSMAKWEMMCREQGTKCEYCDTCTPEIIRDQFIVGINDDTLMSNLVNKAVRDNSITLETVVLQAQQYEATKTRVKSLSQTTEEEVSYMKGNSQKLTKDQETGNRPSSKTHAHGVEIHPIQRARTIAQPKVNNVTRVVDWTTLVKFAYTQIQTGERTEANQWTAALQEGRKQTRCISQMLSPP